jgi:hypothetical protein
MAEKKSTAKKKSTDTAKRSTTKAAKKKEREFPPEVDDGARAETLAREGG